MAIGTYVISGTSKVISKNMGVMAASINATSGTVTVEGVANFLGWQDVASVLTLGLNLPVVLPALNNIQPLDGITIDATSGVVEVILG
jgi:hypothetical protein